jgi:rhodanese-related sulfurtransferase
MLLLTFVAAVCLTGMGGKPAADVAARMTTEDLKARLGAADLVVIDVRAEGDWKESDLKIAGAVREDPTGPDKWAGKYPLEKTFVLYCA